MRLIRLTLALTSPLGTPLVGPTLFGQLCWLKREAEGETALCDWLADPTRVWRISDGFPTGYLPRPLVTARRVAPEKVMAAKAIKKLAFVTRNCWLSNRLEWDERRLDPTRELKGDTKRLRRIAHNVINRRGGSTLEEGGLFFVGEDWRFSGGRDQPDDARVDLYVEAPEAPDAVSALFSLLGDVGYGRDASTGRGRWTVEAAEDDAKLAGGGGSRRMSLSRGALTPETMADALWRPVAHFGRAGPLVTATGASPFKRPVLLTRPGATFRPRTDQPFGRILHNLHPERPEIVLNGLHVTIPFSEARG